MGILDKLAKQKSKTSFAKTFVIEVEDYEINYDNPSESVVIGKELESGETVRVALATHDKQGDADQRQTVSDLSRGGTKGAVKGALLRCDRAYMGSNGHHVAQYFHAVTNGPSDNRGRTYLKATACVYPTFTNNNPAPGKPKMSTCRVGLMDNERAIGVGNKTTFQKTVASMCTRGDVCDFDKFSSTNVAYIRENGFDGLYRIAVGRITRDEDGSYRPATQAEMKENLFKSQTFINLSKLLDQVGECDLTIIPGAYVRVGLDTMNSKAFQQTQKRYDKNYYEKRDSLPADAKAIPGFTETHLTLLKRPTGDYIVIGAAPTETERLSVNGVPIPWADYDPSEDEGAHAADDSNQEAPEAPAAESSAPEAPMAEKSPSAPAEAQAAAAAPAQDTQSAPDFGEGVNDSLDDFFAGSGADESEINDMMDIDRMLEEAEDQLSAGVTPG